MKMPAWAIEFKVDLYALKELGVTARTVGNMRRNPSSVNGALILKVQSMLKEAKEKY